MKSERLRFVLSLSIFAAFLSHPIQALADTDPALAPVLIGNWQYSNGGAVMGTVRFDGLTAGTIYDNRYGTSSFTGKFVSRNVFEGLAVQIKKQNPNSKINLVIEFYHPNKQPATWSFKGWVSDFSNGALADGKKL